jgi:hypothetical protein
MAKSKAEQKIATSTGNATDKWADKLEKEAEDLINEVYHSTGEDEGDKDGVSNDNEEDNNEEDVENKDEGEGGVKEPDSEDTETGEKDKETDDTESDKSPGEPDIETLQTERDRFEKQAKDNKAEYTKGQQRLKEALGRTEEMEETIFNLRAKLDGLSSTEQTTKQEKQTEKDIKKDLVEVSDQLKAINEIDPDIGKAMTPVIEGLIGQIKNLETQVKDGTATAKRTAEEIANDAHFGKLDRAVPGWEDTVKSEEFIEYVDNMSARQKRMALQDLKDGSAEDIIEILKDYNDSLPEIVKANNKKEKVKEASKIANPNLNKTKEVKTSEVFEFTRSEIAKMEPTEYAEKEEAIDKAMAKGLIDMSR